MWVVVQSCSDPVTQLEGTFGWSGLFGLVPVPVTWFTSTSAGVAS